MSPLSTKAKSAIARIAAAVAAVLIACSTASAETLLSIPLPSQGTTSNTSALPNGVLDATLASYGPNYAGYKGIWADTFTNDSGWDVSSISVWAVGASPAAQVPSDVTLYFGPWGANVDDQYLDQMFTNPSVTAVTYAQNTNYNGTGNTYFSSSQNAYLPIYELTFSTSGLNLAAGTYGFGLYSSSANASVLLHSTACAGGNPACDGSVYATYTNDPAVAFFSWATYSQGFDANIQIQGTPAVPEPATLLLIGAGLGLFGLARRRR